jgi:hypothetical protein
MHLMGVYIMGVHLVRVSHTRQNQLGLEKREIYLAVADTVIVKAVLIEIGAKCVAFSSDVA